MADEPKLKLETLQVHAGQESPDPATDSRAVPIYMTTSYVFKDSAQTAGRFALTEPGNIHTRLMNPTTKMFEERMAALEGGVAALATASGSAAITYAVQNIALAGDHVVSSVNLYGGTANLFANTLREQGVETTFVDPSDPENFARAIRKNTKLLHRRRGLRASEGSMAPVACLDGGIKCPQSESCRTRKVWERLDSMIEGHLESLPLSELLERRP